MDGFCWQPFVFIRWNCSLGWDKWGSWKYIPRGNLFNWNTYLSCDTQSTLNLGKRMKGFRQARFSNGLVPNLQHLFLPILCGLQTYFRHTRRWKFNFLPREPCILLTSIHEKKREKWRVRENMGRKKWIIFHPPLGSEIESSSFGGSTILGLFSRSKYSVYWSGLHEWEQIE